MEFLSGIDLTATTILKLLLAAVLGGLVGLEREFRHKPAGLRTNMFICVGSTLFTILSEQLANRTGGDPTRITAQLITGIGFIGAGSIIRARGSVIGLTTAATIFVVASIGVAVGGGYYWTAIFMSLLILVALSFLGWLERRFHVKSELRAYRLSGPTVEALLEPFNQVIRTRDLSPRKLTCRQQGETYDLEFELDAAAEQHHSLFQFFSERQLRCEIVQLPSAEREERPGIL